MCEFELPDVSLRCFVARQLLLYIYALSSVKFQASNCGCVKNVTNMKYARTTSNPLLKSLLLWCSSGGHDPYVSILCTVCSAAETHPNPLCIVCEGIHYLSTDLSIPPPICPYYPPDRPRVIALLILSPRPANFKILQHSKLKIIRHNQFPWLQFLHQDRNHSNSPPHLNLSTNTSWIWICSCF